MNATSYLMVGLALGCMLAVGVSATTLDSTVATDPDDVVDLDYRYLPFGQDTAARLQKAGEAGQDGRKRGPTDRKGREPGSPDDRAETGDGTADMSGGDRIARDGGAGTGPGTGGVGTARESLLDLLANLLPYLLALVGLALAYRYRDRLLALGMAVAGWVAALTSRDAAGGVTSWPGGEPSNDVYRAWLAMVSRANPDSPRVRTPSECARAALDAGIDADTVERLTTLFEEVRYGNEPVTDERVRQARESLQRIEERSGT